jgi:Methylenetetrahydrofolate reductase
MRFLLDTVHLLLYKPRYGNDGLSAMEGGAAMPFTTMCGATLPTALRQRLEPVADDPQAVLETGVDWAWRQCEELLANGAPGVHFYTLNRSLATQRIFARLQESSVAGLLPAHVAPSSRGTC